jgi:hypothetical protein
MKTHIPKPDGRTYCGKLVAAVACINLEKDAIDDATCKQCGKSDDRRTREQWVRSDDYKAERRKLREYDR